jgi:hypothetical protein
LQQIKNDLIGDLVQLGFNGVYEDSSGDFVVPGVSTGGIVNDNDVGTAFMSTDGGIGVSAQMNSDTMPRPRPPRGIVNVSPGRGRAGTTVTVSISGFPKNSTINITLNGQPAVVKAFVVAPPPACKVAIFTHLQLSLYGFRLCESLRD